MPEKWGNLILSKFSAPLPQRVMNSFLPVRSPACLRPGARPLFVRVSGAPWIRHLFFLRPVMQVLRKDFFSGICSPFYYSLIPGPFREIPSI
jgi:hypothetical protein